MSKQNIKENITVVRLSSIKEVAVVGFEPTLNRF